VGRFGTVEAGENFKTVARSASDEIAGPTVASPSGQNVSMESHSVDGYEVGAPATESQIDAVEEQLGARLPSVLRDLYLTCDGILDQPGQWWVVWPLDRLVEGTQSAWNGALVPSALVAFGDDGTGNPFCMRADDDHGALVLRWSWIDKQVEQDEGSFTEFLDEWCGGGGQR
jgi:hypothetical protein